MHKVIEPSVDDTEQTINGITVHGNRLVIETDLEDYDFARQDDDLIITGAGGQEHLVEDFFQMDASGADASVSMPDGSVLGAEEFMDQQQAEQAQEDLAEGSGIGEYSDDSGALLGGIDRLGSLDAFHWDDALPYRVEPLGAAPPAREVSLTEPYSPPSPPGPTPPTPPTPPDPGRPTPPEPPTPPPSSGPFSYSARAVLHAQDVDPTQLNTYYVDSAGIFDSLARAPQVPTVTFIGGDGAQYLDLRVTADGTITFTLKPEALEYFQTNFQDKYIENYYQVSLGGQTYNMQVVVPVHGEFESADYPGICKHGDGQGQLLHGEWHAGRCIVDNDMVYKVTSSNMSDIMTYDGAVHNAEIYTGSGSGDWGADLVNVNCHVQAKDGNSSIIARGDNSVINVHGEMSDAGVVLALNGVNTLEASGKNGRIDITNPVGHGAQAVQGSILLQADGENGRVRISNCETALHAAGGSILADASGAGGSIVIAQAETGLLAELNGSNTLQAESISLAASAAGVIGGERGTADVQNSLQADKNIDITVFGSGETLGVSNAGGANAGSNVLASANGNVSVRAGAAAEDAPAAAATAFRGANSNITAANGNVLLSAENALHSIGLAALDGTLNVNAKTANIKATAAGQGASAQAVNAVAESTAVVNSVQADSIFVRAETDGGKSDLAYGLHALGQNSILAKNELSGSSIRVEAESTGEAYAILADGAASNIIKAAGGSVVVEAHTTGKNDGVKPGPGSYDPGYAAYGIAAQGQGASNSITAGAMDVSVSSDKPTGYNLSVAGIYASGGAENTVTLSGNATFEVAVDRGYGTAIYATAGATNTVSAHDILIEGKATEAAGSFYGIKAGNDTHDLTKDYSENIITANSLTINGDSVKYPGAGLQTARGDNTILLSGANANGNALEMNLNGSAVNGIYNQFGDTKITNTGQGDIYIKAGFREQDGIEQPTYMAKVRGMDVGGGGIDLQNNGNDLSILLSGRGDATGIQSGSGGLASLDNIGKLEIEAHGQRGTATKYDGPDHDSGRWAMGAVGLKVVQDGKINIQNTREVDMTVTGIDEHRFCTGLLSTEGGIININTETKIANSIRIGVEGDYVATGIRGLGQQGDGSRFYVGGAATTEVSITAKSTADHSNGPDANGDLSDLSYAAGVYSRTATQSAGLAETVITAGTVRFDIDATDQAEAYGIYGTQSAQTTINAQTVVFDIDAVHGDAYGMLGMVDRQGGGVSGARHLINADKVTINVDSQEGSAYGLYNHSANDYNKITSSGALELNPECNGSKYSYAMYAAGGDNHIIGNSAAGQHDQITLRGDLMANNGRSNNITSGAGGDEITITGSLEGAGSGRNNITTNAGEDKVTLNGEVTYTNVDLGADDDILIINGSFSSSVFNGGAGFDTLGLDGAGASLSLSGLRSNGGIKAFECLDLSGSNDNELTIDSLLGGLGLNAQLDSGKLGGDLGGALTGQTALLVKTDQGDSVLFGGDWLGANSLGQVSYDGINYEVYKHDSDTEYLLLQTWL